VSAAEWTAQTGDANFITVVRNLVLDALAAADQGKPAALAEAIAELRQQDTLHADSPSDTDGDAAAQNAAKRSLIAGCLTGLEAVAEPDPTGVGAWLDALAASVDWVGGISAAAAETPDLADAAAEADRRAEQIAQMLVSLDAEAREVALGAALPVDGLAVVLERVPATDLPAIAAALAAANAADPSYRDALCRAMVTREAARADEPAAALDEDTAAGAVLSAFRAAPAILAYAAEVAGRAPHDLSDLIDAVAAPGVPSAVSRLGAALHEALRDRFGGAVATELVRGFLLLRILESALSDTLRAEVDQLLAETPRDTGLDDALLRFTEDVVAAGREATSIAAAGDDPDDITVLRGNALQGAEALAATFQEPTPPDPLGTLPTNPVTILGQAILRARDGRPGGYVWGRLQELAVNDTDLYLALIEDERMAVMDLVQVPGGLLDEVE
jgi:hypothetical protein